MLHNTVCIIHPKSRTQTTHHTSHITPHTRHYPPTPSLPTCPPPAPSPQVPPTQAWRTRDPIPSDPSSPRWHPSTTAPNTTTTMRCQCSCRPYGRQRQRWVWWGLGLGRRPSRPYLRGRFPHLQWFLRAQGLLLRVRTRRIRRIRRGDRPSGCGQPKVGGGRCSWKSGLKNKKVKVVVDADVQEGYYVVVRLTC